MHTHTHTHTHTIKDALNQNTFTEHNTHIHTNNLLIQSPESLSDLCVSTSCTSYHYLYSVDQLRPGANVPIVDWQSSRVQQAKI